MSYYKKKPDYMDPRFNPYATETGWDFSNLYPRPQDPPKPTSLEQIAQAFRDAGAVRNADVSQHIPASAAQEIDFDLIETFFRRGKDPSRFPPLVTVRSLDDIKEGEPVFTFTEDNSFEIVIGYGISIASYLFLGRRTLRFAKGLLYAGDYDTRRYAPLYLYTKANFPNEKILHVQIEDYPIGERRVLRIISKS